MAYFLFVDESGHDQRESPYEVLGGIAIKDRSLWDLIVAAQELEIKHFGRRYSGGPSELKGKKLLKTKVFRLASQLESMPIDERRFYAKRCLDSGENAGKKELTALAQAKLSYVTDLFKLCKKFQCRVFASVLNSGGSTPSRNDYLRKDYVYLLERFYYFIEDISPEVCGAIVFDEYEKAQSHILVEQMMQYYLRSEKGKERARLIIPEPFFVHSDLTTGIQIADLIIYAISWGFRTNEMHKEARPELTNFVNQICKLRYKSVREVNGDQNFQIWSIAVINDLQAHGFGNK